MDRTPVFTFSLPKQHSNTEQVAIESNGSVVIVGANGAGKTKLGTWIESLSAQATKVHRISAQKSLSMPDVSRPHGLEQAQNALFFGHELIDVRQKMIHRWQSKPDTLLLNDFDALLVYLFTDDYEQTSKYKRESSESESKIAPPVTKLDNVNRIWESTLPHLKLKIRSSMVEASAAAGGTAPYKASDMSDGERVIFYLVGQAQSVPEGGILVVDEPELHLHKSIQSSLWDNIEAARPDVLFVYLTHDLEFAASRVGAKKICLRSFAPKTGFDWFEIPPETDMPEEMFLKIIGSRKPILFIEGEKSSLDYFIFRHLYSKFTIVPRGSCDQVIQSTISFNAAKALHSIEAFGLIDRDERRPEELNYLETKQKVFSLGVLEVENLFLTEDFLKAIAAELKFNEKDTLPILQKAKDLVLSELGREEEQVVSKLAAMQIESQIKKFNAKAQGESGLNTALSTLLGSIDVAKIYAEQLARIDDIIKSKDYDAAIKVFAHKGLLGQIAPHFGFKYDSLVNFIKRLIRSGDVKVLAALKKFVPEVI
jgi:energy-coupling factor transporter ATP-binding protein EcfA2